MIPSDAAIEAAIAEYEKVWVYPARRRTVDRMRDAILAYLAIDGVGSPRHGMTTGGDLRDQSLTWKQKYEAARLGSDELRAALIDLDKAARSIYDDAKPVELAVRLADDFRDDQRREALYVFTWSACQDLVSASNRARQLLGVQG